jgi:hypothetical protein
MTLENKDISIFVGGYFFGAVATFVTLWVCGVF